MLSKNTDKVGYNFDELKISKNEYDELLQQVLKYYDPTSKKMVKPIPYEQIINMVSLLYKLGYQDEDVYSFLKESEGVIEEDTPARDYSNLSLKYIYLSLSNKFKYYAKSLENIRPHIKNFDIYYGELTKSENEDDYNSCLDVWVEEINTIISIIGVRYDYEITKAKLLLKLTENVY